MSSTNTGIINQSQNKNTSAFQYFNNLSVAPSTVSTDQNDALVAFFQQWTNGNKQSSAILASSVIATALAQNINPMSIVQQFQSVPNNELTLYLAMFLNLSRVGTSLVGINNNQNQNKYITRAILA
jgi:hypothetical protein